MRRLASWLNWRPNFLQTSSAARRLQARKGKAGGLLLEALEDRRLMTLIAPIPSNDVQPTDGTTPLVLQSLGYFSVVDGATLLPNSVTITTPPSHGTATVDPSTGNITYIAQVGFSGTDNVGFTTHLCHPRHCQNDHR